MQRKKGEDDARAVLEATGERVTAARVKVLACLSIAKGAVSHRDIEIALSSRKMNRVTLYRVLDWLVDQGLVFRLTGADRVGRYAAADCEHGTHAHFHCTACGKTVCLEDMSTQRFKLKVPRGYRAEATDLTVRGACAECN